MDVNVFRLSPSVVVMPRKAEESDKNKNDHSLSLINLRDEQINIDAESKDMNAVNHELDMRSVER